MAETRSITRYVHGQSDEYEDLWPFDAEQQTVAHYWLYELEVRLEVDMDTGKALITHLSGVPLECPVRA